MKESATLFSWLVVSLLTLLKVIIFSKSCDDPMSITFFPYVYIHTNTYTHICLYGYHRRSLDPWAWQAGSTCPSRKTIYVSGCVNSRILISSLCARLIIELYTLATSTVLLLFIIFVFITHHAYYCSYVYFYSNSFLWGICKFCSIINEIRGN